MISCAPCRAVPWIASAASTRPPQSTLSATNICEIPTNGDAAKSVKSAVAAIGVGSVAPSTATTSWGRIRGEWRRKLSAPNSG